MNNQNTMGVEIAIEEICNQGCDEVNEVIRKLEQNLRVKQLENINHSDKKLILEELKSIMAVYTVGNE